MVVTAVIPDALKDVSDVHCRMNWSPMVVTDAMPDESNVASDEHPSRKRSPMLLIAAAMPAALYDVSDVHPDRK